MRGLDEQTRFYVCYAVSVAAMEPLLQATCLPVFVLRNSFNFTYPHGHASSGQRRIAGLQEIHRLFDVLSKAFLLPAMVIIYVAVGLTPRVFAWWHAARCRSFYSSVSPSVCLALQSWHYAFP